MFLFVLGRQPEIGAAELTAVFGENFVFSANLALYSGTENLADFDFSRLGSVIKVAKILEKSPRAWNNFANFLPKENKLTLGISAYSEKISAKSIREILQNYKKQRGSVRTIFTGEKILNSGAVLHNKLFARPNKIELIFAENPAHKSEQILAQTIFVQNIDAYTFRDRRRPRRDAHVGMLPPKLAQIMLNLANGVRAQSISQTTEKTSAKNHAIRDNLPSHSATEKITALDPFCGTGVVLQEAALMNFSPIGTDLEPRMIDFSRENLNWLKTTHHCEFDFHLAVGDATEFSWENFLLQENLAKIDLVATEVFLGRAFFATPSETEIKKNIATCEKITRNFLKNLRPQITLETGICLAVPCWFKSGKIFHLPLTREIENLGYQKINFSAKNLVYHRENQIVGREILVLRPQKK